MADLSSGRLKTGTKIDRWSASGDRWCPGTIIDNDCYLFEYQDGDHMWINRKETDQYRLTPNAGQHDVFERESQSQQVLSAVSENHLNINTMRKGQDVEIYDLHRKRWTLGEIYEIREVDDQKTFCIEYDEYCQEIPEEDVQSLLRIPKTDDKANDHEVESKRSIPQQVTWRGIIHAVKQELYPKMAIAFALSVGELLDDGTLKLTVFDEESMDTVIRSLKIQKKSLLNKEIDYIKALVKRTEQYNVNMQNKSEMNRLQNPKSNSINKNESFFRYKMLDDIFDLDPDADLFSNPKWKGLTANLVVDIYGIFKAMKYGAFQRENYSESDFLRDIESAESKILRDDTVSSLLEEIDIESAVSFHPQYVIKDDLFETVNPLLAMSLVLNKLESEQIGNGIEIKCVVVPALIISIYDETKEFQSNIKDIDSYLRQQIRGTNIRLTNEVNVTALDIPKTADILKNMIDFVLSQSNGPNPSAASTVYVVFDRRTYGISTPTAPVHVLAVNNGAACTLSALDNNYFVGMEMEVRPQSWQSVWESQSVSVPFNYVRCWLRFGMQQRVRFVPELLVWIIPSLFSRDSTMKPYDFWSRVYDDDYKHRWSVSLSDDILSKFHHILTGNVLCSVNYHRDEVVVVEEFQVDGLRDHLERTLDAVLMEKVDALISEQRYDSDAVVDDVMVMVMEREREKVHGIDSNICRYFDGPKSTDFHRLKYGVMKYLKIGCDANDKRSISDCPLIENVIQNLIKFEQFGLEIDASNLFEFTLSPLMKGLDHLYRIHEYGLTSGPNRQSIRQHVLQHVQCHLGADCPVVQQHGDRKRENDRRADRQKGNQKKHDGEDIPDELETECEAMRDTLCAAHCYLLHENDELYRLRLAAAELRFATEVVNDETGQKENETKDDDDSKKYDGSEEAEAPLSINYGENVLEWLSFDQSPQFESLREELLYNEDSTMDRDLLNRMTVQCAAAIEDTNYTLKEALGLKTYADATAFQSELRKAHWKGRALQIKRAYFHWAMTLYEAHLYHARPIPAVSGKPRGVYHGLNRMFTMHRELPIYLGPFSVSTQKTVARQFSNQQGLLFTIAPSYVNPFKFSVGIDMITFSSFKNEAEVLFNNQPIPIKQTETFGDAMQQLVDHFLFSLKDRKTRINDVTAFYKKLGVDWNDEWIPIILKHKLLLQKTRCHDERMMIDRLIVELNIMDQRLIDRTEMNI